MIDCIAAVVCRAQVPAAVVKAVAVGVVDDAPALHETVHVDAPAVDERRGVPRATFPAAAMRSPAVLRQRLEIFVVHYRGHAVREKNKAVRDAHL